MALEEHVVVEAMDLYIHDARMISSSAKLFFMMDGIYILSYFNPKVFRGK